MPSSQNMIQHETKASRKTSGSSKNKENKAPQEDKVNKKKKQIQGNLSRVKDPPFGAKTYANNSKTVQVTSSSKPVVSNDTGLFSQKSVPTQTLTEKSNQRAESTNIPTTPHMKTSSSIPTSKPYHVSEGSTAMDKGVDVDNPLSVVASTNENPKNQVVYMEVDKSTCATDNPLFLIVFMFLIWNCRGSSSSKFHVICKNLVAAHKPLILALIEPWVSGLKADKVICKLGFQFNIREEASSFFRGILVLWSSPSLSVSLIYRCRHLVHVSITLNDFHCLFMAVYGSPILTIRLELWQRLRTLKPSTNCCWFIAGDFNVVLTQIDKKGGKPISTKFAKEFYSCLQDCDLLDLEVKGPYFTWERARVMGRIDWTFCNEDWKMKFPNSFF